MKGILSVITLFVVVSIPSIAQRKGDSKHFFKVADVKYSEIAMENKNMLDVYMPRKGSNSPVIIWIHGGSWAFGDKSDVDYKPGYFTSKGFIFISINHRLSPDVKHPQHAQDLAKAIVWVFNNIIHYSGDPGKIYLMGYASGGHLASFVSINDELLSNASGNQSMIKGVVVIDGVGLDLPATIPDAANKFRQYCIDTFGGTRNEWINASPVSYVKTGANIPPFMIIYSGEKVSPMEKEATSLSKKLSEAQVKNKVNNYPKKNNLSINKELGKEDDKVADDIVHFFAENGSHPSLKF